MFGMDELLVKRVQKELGVTALEAESFITASERLKQPLDEWVGEERARFVPHCAKRNATDLSQGEFCRQPPGHDGDCVWEW